jgi:2-methylcitrate dehydratase
MNTYDTLVELIAEYAYSYKIESLAAYQTAKIALQDAIGCAFLSLKFPECTKLLGPIVEGTEVPNGSRVIGTSYILDPILAAFNFGTMIRFLDFNDTWLGQEWAHPSDNIGALLPLADFLSRKHKNLTMKDLITSVIKAYEIQGLLALENSFNCIGFDHVILVKVATSAMSAKLLGASKNQIKEAVSQSFIDTGPLRTYRHAPNTGLRKSWAAGDQCARGVQFAFLTMKGEKGYESCLTAKKYGLHDALFRGTPLKIPFAFGSYVMENILFKVLYPAEFHAQTAVECAIRLHPLIKGRFAEIKCITIETQDAAIRIIDKTGKLNNHADRDHCLQYMVAVVLMKGTLTEDDYCDESAKEPLIDELRKKMEVKENKEFTKNYYDLAKRGIGNAISINFEDGSMLGPISIEYPMGHSSRRTESLIFLQSKFKRNLRTHFDEERVDEIVRLFQDEENFWKMQVSDFVSKLC